MIRVNIFTIGNIIPVNPVQTGAFQKRFSNLNSKTKENTQKSLFIYKKSILYTNSRFYIEKVYFIYISQFLYAKNQCL